MEDSIELRKRSFDDVVNTIIFIIFRRIGSTVCHNLRRERHAPKSKGREKQYDHKKTTGSGHP